MKQEKVFEEVSIKAKARPFVDICSTCNHVQDCVNLQKNDRPVWFCEQFDNHVPIEEQPFDVADFQPCQSPVEDEHRQFQGLCINCENRHNCNLAKPNGGVWHCQEYC